MGCFKEIVTESMSLDPHLQFCLAGLEKELHEETEKMWEELRELEQLVEKDVFTLDLFGCSQEGEARFIQA